MTAIDCTVDLSELPVIREELEDARAERDGRPQNMGIAATKIRGPELMACGAALLHAHTGLEVYVFAKTKVNGKEIYKDHEVQLSIMNDTALLDVPVLAMRGGMFRRVMETMECPERALVQRVHPEYRGSRNLEKRVLAYRSGTVIHGHYPPTNCYSSTKLTHWPEKSNRVYGFVVSGNLMFLPRRATSGELVTWVPASLEQLPLFGGQPCTG